jgi:hypothetical protein
VHSNGTGNPNSGNTGDQIGHDGSSEMNLSVGGQYVCERTGPATGTMAMAVLPFSAASLSISGTGGVPSHASSLSLIGGASFIAGVEGSANVFVWNSGVMDATGDIVVASKPAGSGYVNVGAPSSTATGRLTAQARLLVGGNLASGSPAGHGEVIVKNRGVVTTTGICEIGDPDNDAGSVLRVQDGGAFTANGGLKVWPTAGNAMDLQGGLTHVQAGAFQWLPNRYMTISSTTGSPEFLIDNGVANTGPSTAPSQAQLFVAQSGNGSMRLNRPGTGFSMGTGSCVVADQAGSDGTIVQDSTATLTSAGPMNIGNHGSGQWNLNGGSLGDVGTLAVGVSADGHGYVDVLGADSHLQVRNNLWIGGGFGGAGGGGVVSVRFGGRLDILHTGGINPALTTVYPVNGTLSVTDGVVSTSGDISNRGAINMANGEIDAQSISMTSTGTLRGYGQLAGLVQNAGHIDPGFDFNDMRTIHVDGSFVQFGGGRYTADLDGSNGPVCDLLEINGPATLAGTLDLRPETGFVGTVGQTLVLLTCTSRTGTFGSVTWNGSPLAGQVEVVYEPTFVAAVVLAVSGVEGSEPHTVLSFAPAGDVSHPAFALDLPEASQVQIKAFDLRGREVATLFEGTLASGRREFDLQGSGRQLASGVYLARAVVLSGAATTVKTTRVVLVR